MTKNKDPKTWFCFTRFISHLQIDSKIKPSSLSPENACLDWEQCFKFSVITNFSWSWLWGKERGSTSKKAWLNVARCTWFLGSEIKAENWWIVFKMGVDLEAFVFLCKICIPGGMLKSYFHANNNQEYFGQRFPRLLSLFSENFLFQFLYYYLRK